MPEHFDLHEASSYSIDEVTLPLRDPEPVGDGALKVICPACLSSWRVAALDDDSRDSARSYRCPEPCGSVIRVLP